MLGHLPHPTLHPTYPPSNDGLPDDISPIRLPPRTATRAWKPPYLTTTTANFASIVSSSRSNSPTRSSTFLPFLQSAKERSISPEPVSLEEAAEFEHTPADEKTLHSKPGKLAGWFGGNSEPVNISLIPSPVKEKQDPFFDCAEMERGSTRSSMSREMDTMTRRPYSGLNKSTSSLSITNKELAGSNKFAFWKSKPVAIPEKFQAIEDDLTGLDIQTALFPSGMMHDSSPEAFKELQANAETTISRLQSAYQKKLQSVREVTSEKHVLTDELEAARTRSEHLKLQLANMAGQSAKQESAMQSMAEELAELRCKIREDAEFRSKSLRIVTNECSDTEDRGKSRNTYRRKKRQSEDSLDSEESSSESVFSQAPLGTCTPISAADTSPELYQAPMFEVSEVETKDCQNCHGVARSEAWDVVHMLKEESSALKARIAQCESANEDALSLLNAVSSFR